MALTLRYATEGSDEISDPSVKWNLWHMENRNKDYSRNGELFLFIGAVTGSAVRAILTAAAASRTALLAVSYH